MIAALLAALALSQSAAAPPSERETEALVEEYVALDPKTEAGRARGDEILARVATLPPLSERDAAAWRKRIAKLAAKGPRLEAKSGRHFLWPDEERGLYIVGGKSRSPKGLFIGLHGGGVGQGDAETARSAFEGAADELGWVAIFPEVLEKTERGWTDAGTEEFVIELVERALRTWKVERSRVFVGGHSMGGYGAWTVGARHADLFAGLAASAGAPTPIYGPGGSIDIDEGVIPNLRNVRMVVYQSDDDPRVPPDANRRAAELIAEARAREGGYDFEYWEVPNRQHELPPGGTIALLERIAEHRRQPIPDTVLWQPRKAWPRQLYWLWWDRPVARALVSARLDAEKAEVRVQVSGGADGLYVLLDERMLPLDREVAVFLGDAEVFRGVPERSLAALLSTGARGDEELSFEVRIPLAP